MGRSRTRIGVAAFERGDSFIDFVSRSRTTLYGVSISLYRIPSRATSMAVMKRVKRTPTDGVPPNPTAHLLRCPDPTLSD